jgi:hypothetical protein
MFASLFIIVFSTALLLYWFRYSCALLLQNGQSESLQTIDQATFRFGEIQDRLRTDSQLAPLHALLQRDYEVLTYLTKHAAGLHLDGIEERLLVWDYKLMACWYSVTRTAAPEQARLALREMATVLTYLAGRVGERAGVHGEA